MHSIPFWKEGNIPQMSRTREITESLEVIEPFFFLSSHSSSSEQLEREMAIERLEEQQVGHKTRKVADGSQWRKKNMVRKIEDEK